MMNDIRDLNTGSMWRVWGIRGLAVLLGAILLAGTVLVPSEITLAQGEETECPECGGDGKVACSNCNGSGITLCERCSGKGTELCSMPGGWGVYCGGTGICSACKGDGIFSGVKCPGCGGTGVCQQCNGTGQMKCLRCRGNAQGKCAYCGGSGEVSCTRCSGTGVIYTEEEASATEEDIITGIYEDTEGDRANVSAIKAELRNATREELEKALDEIHQYGEGYWLDSTNIYYNLLSQVRANQSLRETPPEAIEGYEFVGRTIIKESIQWAENVQAFGWADDPEMIHRVIGEMEVEDAILVEGTEISDHYRELEGEASAVTSATEGTKLTVMSGEVEVQKGGSGEWTKFDQTSLKSGDEFRTGENSKAVIETAYGDIVTVGQETHITTVDIVDMDRALTIWIGEIKADIKKWIGKFEVRTPSAVTSVRGTEFTVSVDEYGTTTVMVLDGIVEVRDLTSNSGITLPINQMVTVPKGGLTQEEILEKAELVWPEEIDRWWEEDLVTTNENNMADTNDETATTSSGFGVKDLVAITAIILVLILVFGPLLKRRHDSSPG